MRLCTHFRLDYIITLIDYIITIVDIFYNLIYIDYSFILVDYNFTLWFDCILKLTSLHQNQNLFSQNEILCLEY